MTKLDFTDRAQLATDGQPNAIPVVLNTSTYPREAVLRACYWLAADASFSIVSEEPGKMVVSVTPLNGVDPDGLIKKLHQALVDFAIRVDIEVKTADIRNLVWQTAFAEVTKRKS